MSGGRGSRKKMGLSPDEVAARQHMSCAYSERLCQRPIANPANSLCWAHSRAVETNAHHKSKTKKGSEVVSLVMTSPQQSFSQQMTSSKPEPSDLDKMQKLTSTYVAPCEKAQDQAQIEKPISDTTNQFDYLDAIGSINVDDPTAAFTTMDDSASDDGSDEFGSSMPLGHAGVYSAEEVVSLACDRMQRLRRLYVEELKQIGVQMKLSRRRYLAEVSRDRRRRIGDPLTDYIAITPEQQKAQRILRAMRRHRRRYPSPSNILRWTLSSKLKQPQSTNSSDPQHSNEEQPLQAIKQCVVTSCEEISLPLTKHCWKHILLDRRQLLFTKCPGFVINEEKKTNDDQQNTCQIDCGRLAVQGPTPAKGSSSRNNTPSPVPPSAAAINSTPSTLCSTHRVLVQMAAATPNK